MRFILFCLPLLAYTQTTFSQELNNNTQSIVRYGLTNGAQQNELQHRYFLVVKNDRAPIKEVEIMRRLSDTEFIIRTSEQTSGRMAQMFQHIIPVNSLWKLSENLWPGKLSGQRSFVVRCKNEKPLADALRAKGISAVVLTENLLITKCKFSDILKHVLDLDEVTYVGEESMSASEESRVLDLNLNPNTVNMVHHYLPSLTGEGITISIKELRYNPADIDLRGRDKSSSLASADISNHATDMATIAAGAGNSFITGKGAAWKSTLTSSDFASLLPDPVLQFQSLDVSVQNHAYGTVIENMYGELAAAYDQNANNLQTLMHVFSAGNQGTVATTHGKYQGIAGYANITGNFKMSKNTLTIGSVDTTGNIISFVSRGPAYDGRIKPELVTYSTQGSSNSAALASGTVVLLQQAYKNMFGSLPASALIKSILINSANDAGPPGIDFITGYGNIDAYRSVKNLTAGNYFSGSIQHLETKTFNLNVPANARNLKVTLVWNDPAAVVNSNTALINDLDLSLVFANGPTLPWILNASPSLAQLTQPATRGVDRLNNQEQVSIDVPTAGTHTIEVKGFDIPQGPQAFYIAYQWDIADAFEWKFPTGSDNFPYNGETGTYFYWNSTFPNPTGILEYSLDDGATWNNIASVDLKKGNHRWSNPPIVTSSAIARMRIGASTFMTEKFTISYPPDVSIGFDCPDSVMYHWPKVENALVYNVLSVPSSFMTQLTTVTDTAIVIHKSSTPSTYFSVQPKLPDNALAIRSPSINYETFGAGCFLQTFYDEGAGQDGIRLNALLGTTYAVSEIVFEHEINGNFVPIGVVEVTNDVLLTFLHDEPLQGVNRYRARVLLENGEQVVSETVESFFISKSPYVVFPNPVMAGTELRILARDVVSVPPIMRVFKTDGTFLKYFELSGDREFITVEIPSGLYLYTITSENGIFRGKLVVKD